MTQTVLSGWRFRALLLTVLCAVAGYLAFVVWGGWNEVALAVSRVGWFGMAIILSLSLVNYALRFVRWQRFLRVLGHRVPTWPSMRIYIGGFGLTVVPGKVGETVRSVFLKPYGVSYPESLAAFFSEQFSNLVSLLLLAGIGLWAYPQAHLPVAVMFSIVLTILIVMQRTAWMRRIEQFARERLPGRLGTLFSHGANVVLHAGSCLKLPGLWVNIVISVIAWGAEGVAFFYLMQLLGSSISLSDAVFIYAFSMLVGAVSFLPGGLGGMEAAMVTLLILNQVPAAEAVAATVLIRLATLWFAVALGLTCLPFCGKQSEQEKLA